MHPYHYVSSLHPPPAKGITRQYPKKLLKSSEMHVWVASAEDFYSDFEASNWEALLPLRLKQYSPYNKLISILSIEEQKVLANFKAPLPALLYLLAHAMTRLVLENYEPGLLTHRKEFSRQAHGKPFITGTPSGLPLYFNISHSWPWAALAVTRTSECGIDIERSDSNFPWRELCSKILHPQEQHAIICAPSPELEFFRYWTLKEAATKTLGLGLLWDFTSFAVQTQSGSVVCNKKRKKEISVYSVPCSCLNKSVPGFLSVGCMVSPEKMPAISVHRFNAAEYGIETQKPLRIS